ncbi:MAG: PAS domain-containing protein [Deltaproteobacteria bacterium]|nr:MAG: PAS domain-containing protein [Deltaproteobacteria bacterium]
MMKSPQKFPPEIFLQDVHEVLYSALVQNTGHSFTIVDQNYRIIWTNQLKENNFVTGKVCFEVIYNRSSPCHDPNCVVKNIFHNGKACMNEKCIQRQDGSRIWKEVRAYPVFDNRDNLIYSLNIGHDITYRRMEQEKQKRYLQYLEKSLDILTRKQNYASIKSETIDNHINLTGREIEVLRLMADGFTNNEMAIILSISRNTIKSHVVHLFDKLGVNNRTQAVVQATRLNLI